MKLFTLICLTSLLGTASAKLSYSYEHIGCNEGPYVAAEEISLISGKIKNRKNKDFLAIAKNTDGQELLVLKFHGKCEESNLVSPRFVIVQNLSLSDNEGINKAAKGMRKSHFQYEMDLFPYSLSAQGNFLGDDSFRVRAFMFLFDTIILPVSIVTATADLTSTTVVKSKVNKSIKKSRDTKVSAKNFYSLLASSNKRFF